VWEFVDIYSIRYLGLTEKSPLFFLYCGLGAALGVFAANVGQLALVYGVSALHHAAEKQPLPATGLFKAGAQFSFFLAAAAFCSGFAWQPLMNVLTRLADLTASGPGHYIFHGPDNVSNHVVTQREDNNARFFVVLFGLWLLDGLVYFIGSQAFRAVLSFGLAWDAVEPPLKRSSLLYDGTLAISVGACAGSFYCVDAQNALTSHFDVHPQTSLLMAAFLGGIANLIGFILAQGVQNVLLPPNTSWADLRVRGRRSEVMRALDQPLGPYRPPCA